MTASNFDYCLALTLGFEGGYVDNVHDPGGATNRGITQAVLAKVRGHAVSKAEVRALTHDEAKAIYRRLYWNSVAGDELPDGVDAVIFDFAVNSGPARAISALYNVLGLPPQPQISREALAAASHVPAPILVSLICAHRLSFLNKLKNFSFFGKGWSRRVRAVEQAALSLAARALPTSAGNIPAKTVTPNDNQSEPNLKGKIMNTSALLPADNAKPFWASQTIWSAVAVIGSSLAGSALAWKAGDINAFGTSMTAVFGGIYAIVGRVRAREPIV